MKKKKLNPLTITVIVLWLIVIIFDRERAQSGVLILLSFLKEMVQILPFVLILSALVGEWIPAQTVKRHLGEDSGFRGALFAYILGSLSAGPVYAAFPVCISLKKKGASVGNLTILISSWAVIKIPMLFMELKSLGLQFTALRYALTVPAIFTIGYILNRLVSNSQMTGLAVPEVRNEVSLPGKNCGSCGFGTCEELFQAVKGDKVLLKNKCSFMD